MNGDITEAFTEIVIRVLLTVGGILLALLGVILILLLIHILLMMTFGVGILQPPPS